MQGNNASYWYVCIILRNEEDYRFIYGATGIACAQTYSYDAANETLVIKGKGNSVADPNITSSIGSLEIGAATGDISATDVSNGLNVGDVGNVNVSGTNANVLDGKTVSGGSFAARLYAHQRWFSAGRGCNITEQWRVYADYAEEISGEIYHNVNAGIQFRF